MLWLHKERGTDMETDWDALYRMLDAIDYAAQRLGYNVREVSNRTEKIRTYVMVRPYGPDVRQYVINLREYDQPPQWATSTWLYEQLDRVIGHLSTPEQLAEELAIAARMRASLAVAWK
jgi:hypothetical protein